MRSAIIAAVALLAACQSSDVSREVGARCDKDTECDERCLVSSPGYPGGFCTIACDTRADCPGGSTCADREGGVCLFTCNGDRDCTFLGTGWRCDAADLRGAGIKVNVCRGN